MEEDELVRRLKAAIPPEMRKQLDFMRSLHAEMAKIYGDEQEHGKLIAEGYGLAKHDLNEFGKLREPFAYDAMVADVERKVKGPVGEACLHTLFSLSASLMLMGRRGPCYGEDEVAPLTTKGLRSLAEITSQVILGTLVEILGFRHRERILRSTIDSLADKVEALSRLSDDEG